MQKSNEETHISVTRATHDKIKEIAKEERRTLRAVVDNLVNIAYIKLGKK